MLPSFEKWISNYFSQQEIPQQMNGSDCGMFTCKYAEYITKDKPITFTQVSTSTAKLPLCVGERPVFNTIWGVLKKFFLFDTILNLAFTIAHRNSMNITFINSTTDSKKMHHKEYVFKVSDLFLGDIESSGYLSFFDMYLTFFGAQSEESHDNCGGCRVKSNS